MSKNTRNDLLLSSPSVTKVKLDRIQVDNKKRLDRERWARRQHKKILEQSGIKILQKQMDIIAPNDIEELGKKFFDKKKIDQDDLCRYLFAESCAHAKTARFKNKSHVSTNDILIIFGYLH